MKSREEAIKLFREKFKERQSVTKDEAEEFIQEVWDSGVEVGRMQEAKLARTMFNIQRGKSE